MVVPNPTAKTSRADQMAQSVSTQALIGELANSIVARHATQDKAAFVSRTAGDVALRTLRNHRFARTNQFNVRRSLDGLLEKFQLFNNDALADALDSRLRRLALVDSKFAPEILALLLLLSDNPAAQPGVDRLEHPRPATPPAPLTWKDIVADDPFYDDELFVQGPSRSSSAVSDSGEEGDEYLAREIQSPPIAPEFTRLSLAPEALDPLSRAESLVVDVDSATFDDIISARGAAADSKRNITELQSIRQVLNMLHGLPSFLFEAGANTAELVPVNNACVDHLSQSVFTDLLAGFAQIGSVLAVLRRNVFLRHAHPLLHAFEAAVEHQIKQVDDKLTELEQAFAKGHGQVVASLLNLLVRVRAYTRHLPALRDIVVDTTDLDRGCACHLLNRLFDCTCELQATGDDGSFRTMAAIFFDCLNVFLRSIRRWMEHGQLEVGFELVSTVTVDAPVDPGMFWERKYSVQFASGCPLAPRFLIPLVPLVVSSGKSVAFLKELGIETQPSYSLSTHSSLLTIDMTQETDGASGLLPFSALLDQKLPDWVSSRHQLASAALCDHLLHRFGVARTVDALEYLYLSKDGAAFESFADRIFSRLDTDSEAWNDPDAVANIAQYVFGAFPCVDSAFVSIVRLASTREAQKRAAATLASFKLNYNYAWPIQNILPVAALDTYQQIFTLLIQIHRASRKLSLRSLRVASKSRLEQDPNPSPTTATAAKPELQQQSYTLKHHLHHRMLHLVRTLQGYMTQTAIQMSCLSLRAAFAAANDVDDMVAAHASFIKAVERRCLLAKPVDNARKALTHLLELVYAFADLSTSPRHRDKATASSKHNDRAASDATAAPLDSDLDASEQDEELAADPETKQSREVKSAESDMRVQRGLDLDPEALVARLRQMKAQYTSLLSIAVAGLRSAGREEGAEEAWEELAERLEWSLGR